ncbi:flagellar filament capping protein FliD [Verrucomicrobia bacterium]|nr:flagellar filament capping protein FliD [Verrucomicrobiota bacterium]
MSLITAELEKAAISSGKTGKRKDFNIVELGLSGLASGFDWRTMVDQLVDLDRIPQRRLLREQAELFDKNSTYQSLQTELGVLKGRVENLSEGDLFDSRKVNIGNETLVEAKIDPGATLGSHSITVSQLATASNLSGTSSIGSSLNSTSDVTALTLSNAPFRNAITDGTITVDGKRIDITSSQSLQDVFDAISTATSGTVTGTYNPSTDAIQLSSTSEIVLGSANDTSNFLQEAQLFNNGTGTVSSSKALGKIQTSASLNASNYTTAVSDGGAGAGEFKINGISIAFDASTDSLENVIDRINQSQSGVLASYDAASDRVILTNQSTGDLGVSVEDVTGNFLAATGLTAGTLSRGQNLQFTINGGETLTSYSNTADSNVTGVSGLSLTALQTGTTTVTVESDRGAIEKGINDFVSQFNKVQSFIDKHTATSTNSLGSVTAGVLNGESEVESIASQLRSIVTGEISGLNASMNHLNEIGISSSGYDNNINVSDSSLLSESLINNLDQVKAIFQNASSGVGVQMMTFLDQQIGDEGALPDKVTRLTEQSTDIDDQMARMESLVAMRKQSLIDGFVAMELAQQKINQQMSFLSAKFSAQPAQ